MEFSWSLYDIWRLMNVIEKASILTMALMSLCALYTLLLHWFHEARAHIAAKASLQILRQKPLLGEAIADLKRHAQLLSLIVLSGLEAFQHSPSSVTDTEAVHLAESAMRRCERTIHLDAELSLIPLDTIANVAPLIGMVATIIGIFSSFRGHFSRATGLQSVSFGVAFALLPLAVGLSVALISAWGYGNVTRSVETLDAQSAGLMRQVIVYLHGQCPRRNTNLSEVGAPPVTRLQKVHHRGTRLVVCALWMWWLLFAIPMGIGIVLGVYSLFTRS